MKRLINIIRKSETAVQEPAARITTDTVAEHREKILAGGRKFKYPVQYTRRRLVMVATAIGALAVVVSIAVGWWQLYQNQSTSDFMYHVTEVLPLPVANVDGEMVLYRDYLMKYRSSIYYLEQKEGVDFRSDDGKRRIAYIKRQSMQDAIADAFAIKLARELKLSVSDTEVETFIKQQRQTANGELSEQAYNAVIMDHFGWSIDEYRHEIRNKLTRQKVSYEVDQSAKEKADEVSSMLKDNSSASFKKIASSIGDSVSYGNSGWVPKTNQDGGLAAVAAKMKPNKISGAIKPTTGDGYYFIRLTSINDSQVKYEYIKISLATFDLRLKQADKTHKISEYILIPQN